MSKIALKSNPLGTGTFTIESPNSNTDRTVVLPDGNGDVVLTDATQTLTNKSISGAQINSGTVAVARLGSGTPGSGNFLRGDGSWEAVPSATIASTAEAEAGTNNTNFITPLRMREGFNASGSAPVYACRAWVNFDGRSASLGIRASGNVSSVTRSDTGRYEINLTTAMPDANYATVVGTNKDDANDDGNMDITTGTTSIFQTTTKAYVTTGLGTSIARRDSPQVSVAIFR